MAFFNKLFGKGEEQKNDGGQQAFPWKNLEQISDLESIALTSKEKTQVIFKHSTTCGISRMVIKMFTGDNANLAAEETIDFHYLDLLQHRDISNAIADTFGVIHESPQLLVIKNGKVVTNASHGGINEIDLTNYA